MDGWTWLAAAALGGLLLVGALVALRRPPARAVASARLAGPGPFTLTVPPGPEPRSLWLTYEIEYPDARREHHDTFPEHYAIVLALDAGGRRETVGCGEICPRGVRVVDDRYGGMHMTIGGDRCSSSTTARLATYPSSPGVISGVLSLSPDATLRQATIWVS
jgi:hypothetical protein